MQHFAQNWYHFATNRPVGRRETVYCKLHSPGALMNGSKRIALLMGQDIGYCRGVLRGIHSYALHRQTWIFRGSPPDTRVLGPLRQWQPHGVIAHLFDRPLSIKHGLKVPNSNCLIKQAHALLIQVLIL